MYVDLLDVVLHRPAAPEVGAGDVDPLEEVVGAVRRRQEHATRVDPGWALQALADELAYDAALVRLAHQGGLAWPIGRFGAPGAGRAELEEELGRRGVGIARSAGGQHHPVTPPE